MRMGYNLSEYRLFGIAFPDYVCGTIANENDKLFLYNVCLFSDKLLLCDMFPILLSSLDK